MRPRVRAGRGPSAGRQYIFSGDFSKLSGAAFSVVFESPIVRESRGLQASWRSILLYHGSLLIQGECMNRKLYCMFAVLGLLCFAGQPLTIAQQTKKPAGKAHSAKANSKKPVKNAFA